MNKFNVTVCYHDVLCIKNNWKKGYFYVIYKDNNKILEGHEYFESELRARLAGLGHMSLLEKEFVNEN